MNIAQFNTLYATDENKVLIQKALSTATGSGGALIPEHLEDVITNTAVRLVPELAIPVLRFDNQKYHEFNKLNTLPTAGSAMGESSTTPIRNSGYSRDSVELKIMKRKGTVTGFLKDTSANYIDAIAAEMENHVQSFGNDIRTYFLFGNKGADQYTFDGIDYYVASNRVQLSGASQVLSDLKPIDAIIDKNTRYQGKPHRKVFLTSPEMLSAISRLWTNVRDVRDASRGTKAIQIDGGYRLETYRGIPFLETTGTRPTSAMGTVTLGAAGTGSGLTPDEYWIRIAPVTWDGEQGASASNNSITITNEDSITASFTAISNALYYKVYVGLSDGTEVLVKIVSAFTYDSDGTPTGVVSSVVFTVDPTTVDTNSVPTHMQADIPLELDAGNGEPNEYFILWDLDEYQGLGKVAYTNEAGSRFKGLITPMELAQTDDNYPFLLKSYASLVPSFEKTSAIIRSIRTV